MKPVVLATVALVLTASLAVAQQGKRGSHFIENWDQNEDGIVSLAEVTERREDVFAAFDQNHDGFLSADDYVQFDEARANDQANNAGQGNQGGGQGGGKSGGKSGGRNSEGMTLAFNDVNGDGQVSHDEFMTRTVVWFTQIDRNGSGAIDPADFGRG
ncbi:MAG: EF-hand domain-containing protein [Rhodobacterales bacterium]|nr:EF-hand domain-containing protein [Rhodobacterales bacterium]